MIVRPNLDDARALLDRARKHFVEFNALLNPNHAPGLWGITERRDLTTAEFFYRLHLDRRRLIEAKPIIADSANNIASAMDHIVAAIAKANGHERSRTLFFPWGVTDEVFEKALAKVEPIIGTEMARVLAAARAKHKHEIHHLEAAKQISNSGKHWELMFAAGSAHGVVLHMPGQQPRIFQVPGNAFVEADAFEYYRGVERLPRVPVNIVIGQTIDGLDEGLPKAPDSILECSFRFVEELIIAVEAAAELRAGNSANLTRAATRDTRDSSP